MKQRRSAERPQVRELIEGRPAVRRAVIDGSIPVPVEDLLEAQAAIVYQGRDDAEEAAEVLFSANPEVLIDVLQTGTSPRLAEFCFRRHHRSEVRVAAARHRAMEPWILAEMASAGGPELQRVLVQRQDVLAVEPAILHRLRANPDLTADVERRLGELEELASASSGATENDVEIAEATAEETEAAIEEAREAPALGEVDAETMLSEGQVRLLPPSVKLRLCKGANVRIRNFLVRDTNPYIATSVLKMSSFTASEVERIARARTVKEEVLVAIAADRRWFRKYPVRRALVSNPKTPVAIALKLLPGVAPRDLKDLRMDRNIAEAVRSRARQLYRVRVG